MSQSAVSLIDKTPKQRLSFHLSEIEKEFDLLLEENAELKRRLAHFENLKIDSPNIKRKEKEYDKGSIVTQAKSGKKINHGVKIKPKTKASPKGPVTTVNNTKKMDHSAAPLQKSDMWVRTKELPGHRDGVWEVTTCKWSLKRIGSASADRTARIWALTQFSTLQQVLYLGHSGSVNSIRFHPRERLVCTGSGDKTVHVWKIPPTTKKENVITSQSGNLLGENRKPSPAKKLWSPLLRDQVDDNMPDIPEIDIEFPENKKDSVQRALDISNDFTSLQAEANETANLHTITQPQTIISSHTAPVLAADWVDGSSILISSVALDNSLIFWDPEQNSLVANVSPVHEENHSFTNITSGPANLCATSSTDGIVRIWDHRTSKSPIVSILSHESAVNSALFLHTDDNVIISGGDDRACRTWDIRNVEKPLCTIRGSSAVNRFSVSPMSSTIAIPMDDRRTKLCDTTGNRLGNVRSHDKGGHTAMITSTAWSNDESVVYTSSFSRAGSIIAWTKDLKVEKKQKKDHHNL